MAKSVDEIINNVRRVLKDQNSELASFPDYGNLYVIFRAVASVISEQDSQLDSSYESLFVTTSSNQNLDEKAKEYGITRNQGTPATGSVIIEADPSITLSGSLIIKQGTILLNPYTNKQYVVKTTTTINNPRTNLLVESLDQSNNSNVEAGTRLTSNFYRNSNFIVGDSFNNITNEYEGDITGGSEKESDDSLRGRILNIMKVKQSSTRAALDSTIREIQGINQVLIEENVPSVGYINIYIDNTNFDVINEAKLKADRVKPLGVILFVKPFETISLNIELNVSLFSAEDLVNKNAELRSIITNFVGNLNNSFTKESLAGVLLNTSLVSNVEVINPTNTLNIQPKQKFTVGSINIQYI